MADAKCPLCDGTAIESGRVTDRRIFWVSCRSCGDYSVSDEAIAALTGDEMRSTRFKISAATRRASDANTKLELLTGNLATVADGVRVPDSPLDVLDDILLAFERKTGPLTLYTRLEFADFPLFALHHAKELGQLVEWSVRRLQYIEGDPEPVALSIEGAHAFLGRPTVQGWNRIHELRSVRPRSPHAFVAMSFKPELDDVWKEGFKPGIEDAGYFKAYRVNVSESFDRVDDLILSGLRRSGLVVADFTFSRGNVYFEAGFGMGLGVPVIFTCREDHFDAVEFDAEHYPFLLWKSPADLRSKLTTRILAGGLPRP